MTTDDIRATVLGLLSNIAPEADPALLRPDKSLREQLDVDSVDLLNFMIAVHEAFGVEIPERDYPKLLTLNGCVEYLKTAVQSRPS